MQAPAMKAVLLLLALCGLSAVYAASPTAEDVRETGKVSPIDPVGFYGAITSVLSSQGHEKDNTRRLHQVGLPLGSTPGIVAAGASSSADPSGDHGAVITVHDGQTDIMTNDNGQVHYSTPNTGRRLLWGGWGGGWGRDRGGEDGYNGGGGSAAASSSAAAAGNSAAAAAAAAAASGRGRHLLDWGCGHHDDNHGHGDRGRHHDDRRGWGSWHSG